VVQFITADKLAGGQAELNLQMSFLFVCRYFQYYLI